MVPYEEQDEEKTDQCIHHGHLWRIQGGFLSCEAVGLLFQHSTARRRMLSEGENIILGTDTLAKAGIEGRQIVEFWVDFSLAGNFLSSYLANSSR